MQMNDGFKYIKFKLNYYIFFSSISQIPYLLFVSIHGVIVDHLMYLASNLFIWTTFFN